MKTSIEDLGRSSSKDKGSSSDDELVTIHGWSLSE